MSIKSLNRSGGWARYQNGQVAGRRPVSSVVMGPAKTSSSRSESMGMCKQIGIGLLVVASVVGGSLQTVLGSVVQSADEAAEFPQAALACKVKVGAITEGELGSPSGTKCDATCEVISWLPGASLGSEKAPG